ncbi:MAG: antitoxin VapB family protein [Archaeoglobaceae archaeon]
MGKTITIADDVYNELVKVKGKKSFSEVIRDLIKKEGNSDILLIGFGTRNEEEMGELKEELKEVEEWMQSLTQA